VTGAAGVVLAISLSDRRGVPKANVDRALLVADWGLAGDAHAGPGTRQVSLLADESIDTMRARGLALRAGDFAENITTRGVDLLVLQPGDRLRLAGAELEITQIGKECHARCSIYARAGDCVMPREGVFARVTVGGEVRPGDRVEVRRGTDAKSEAARGRAR
jgi:molybdopterin adenylyltransferase